MMGNCHPNCIHEGVTVSGPTQSIKLSHNFNSYGDFKGSLEEKVTVSGTDTSFVINASAVEMKNLSHPCRIFLTIENLSNDDIVSVTFMCSSNKETDVLTIQKQTSKPFKAWSCGKTCNVTFELNFAKLFIKPQLAIADTIPGTLAGDLKSFLDGGLGGPIVTLFGSDGEVEVPKMILQMRSPALMAKLCHGKKDVQTLVIEMNDLNCNASKDMKESNSSTIELKEFNCKTLKSFCDYLMTDIMSEDKSVTIGLYLLADKYNVQRLKKSAEAFILKNLKDFDKKQVFDLLFKTNQDLFYRLLDEKYGGN